MSMLNQGSSVVVWAFTVADIKNTIGAIEATPIKIAIALKAIIFCLFCTVYHRFLYL